MLRIPFLVSSISLPLSLPESLFELSDSFPEHTTFITSPFESMYDEDTVNFIPSCK